MVAREKQSEPDIYMRLRCSPQELTIIDMKANQQKLSRSRYLVEAALNVGGIADWRERAKREQGIFELRKAIHSLEQVSAKKDSADQEGLLIILLELKRRVEQLLHFYKTNSLMPEDEASLTQPDKPKLASNYLEHYSPTKDRLSVLGNSEKVD